jgi:NADPH:quinone reductase-like Zn-dependent oxidoreductase
VGNHSLASTRQALGPSGLLNSNVGGHAGGKLSRTIRALLASLVWKQQARPTVKTQNLDDLVAVKALVEAGIVRPVIDSTFELAETAKAIERVAGGHARGTVVVSVVDPGLAHVPSAPASSRIPDAAAAAS